MSHDVKLATDTCNQVRCLLADHIDDDGGNIEEVLFGAMLGLASSATLLALLREDSELKATLVEMFSTLFDKAMVEGN